MVKKGFTPWNKGKTGFLSLKKNKTYEELYGVERSIKIKNKIRQFNKNKIVSNKTKNKMRLSQLGKIISEETKEKLRKAALHQFCEKGHPMLGTHRSEETKEKLRIAKQGIPCSEEVKAKIRKSTLGKKNHFYGKTHSDETKNILREHRLKQISPSKDTNIELMIKNELTKRNIIFESQKTIFGRPDIFIEPNICIFCDGDYWHANPTKYKPNEIISRQHNRSAKNIQNRDWEVTRKLTEQNYFVIRFWETDIHNNINQIGEKIQQLLK